MASTAIPGQPASKPTNYLTNGYTIKSWLLTTDHKRIAILYLISITLFFFLGGVFAMLIRLALVTAQGGFLHSHTSNKVSPLPGVISVCFLLVPVLPPGLANSSRSLTAG